MKWKEREGNFRVFCSRLPNIKLWETRQHLSFVVSLKRQFTTCSISRLFSHKGRYIHLYSISLSISSQAFSKDRTSSFVYIFSSQTSITCFGIPPWSHGIWFMTDKNSRSQNKQTQLSLSPEISQRKWEPSPRGGDGKKVHPSGVSPFLSLTDWLSLEGNSVSPKGCLSSKVK